MKNIFVVLVLALSLLLCSFLSVLADGEKVSVGVLSFLNLSEEDYLNCTQLAINAVKLLEEEGYAEVFKWELQNPDLHIVFYDDLNTMLLGSIPEISKCWKFRSAPRNISARRTIRCR